MKTYKTILVMTTMLFVLITAVLSLALVFDLVDSQEMKDTLVKIASACGIIAVAGIAMTLLSRLGSK